jgi:nicotinic acid mononucleotide adenylyltransferase
MTQLTPEHFELHDSNKDKRYQEQKISNMQDRIGILEKAIEHLNKIVIDLRENKLDNPEPGRVILTKKTENLTDEDLNNA